MTANIGKLTGVQFTLWCSYQVFFNAGRIQPDRKYTEILDPVERLKYFLKVSQYEGKWTITDSIPSPLVLQIF